MNGSFTTDAIVLRRAEWRDYDRMVTLLTPLYGRVDAVARGCRKPKSPLLNAAEPFTCGEYQLVNAHDKLTVSQCRITDSFFELRQDYERLTHGAYWLRLLEEIAVPNEPNEALFQMTLKALTYLTHSSLPPSLMTAMFEMQLWRFSGFSPNVEGCVICAAKAEKTPLRFDAQRGGCVCALCAPGARHLSEGARRILLKAPRARFEAAEKLLSHPDWPEAALRIREFTFARLGHEVKNAPSTQG